ncbi:4Fe-4S dicluster domain-containing protein [candidate division KSB1 bacterium]|nr:4Fe-4S dicluster domain-containing protein [candidate division KSB1 bacterium]
MNAAILNDMTKCIGCKACTLACKEINGLPKDAPSDVLSSKSWTAIEQKKGINIKRQCMHCNEPACVSACPVGALTKTETGAVTYDAKKCMGCRYCLISCPFSLPTYEWDKPLPKVTKCILCYDNALKKGEQPACTRVCPTGATKFGDRDELIQEAKDRIAKNPDRYVNHIYGLTEAGGTSVIYLSSVPFAELGFPVDRQDEAYPKLTWKVLSQIPNIVSTSGILLLGTWWIINRRIKLENNENNSDDESVINS